MVFLNLGIVLLFAFKLAANGFKAYAWRLKTFNSRFKTFVGVSKHSLGVSKHGSKHALCHAFGKKLTCLGL